MSPKPLTVYPPVHMYDQNLQPYILRAWLEALLTFSYLEFSIICLVFFGPFLGLHLIRLITHLGIKVWLWIERERKR